MLTEYIALLVQNPFLILIFAIKVGLGFAVVMTALYCWMRLPFFLARLSKPSDLEGR